jgi:uncharacterized phage protein (TIGR02218 family)
MRSWNATLLTMLGGSEISRCFLAELTSTTGQTVRVTSHDVDRVIGAETYLKTPGFNLTRYTVKNGGEAATIDFEMPLSDDGPILIEDVRRGAWRGATIVLWIAHTATPADRNVLAQGFVGRTDYGDRLQGSMELVTLADALKDIVLFTIQPACPWKFASRQCGAVEATWTRAGAVSSVTSRRKFTATITSPGTLSFTHGKVNWTSGDNAGAEGWVRQWTSGSGLFEMVTDFPFDIQAGDAFDVLAGCQKNRTDCAVYGQLDRYGGFDFVAL